MKLQYTATAARSVTSVAIVSICALAAFPRPACTQTAALFPGAPPALGVSQPQAIAIRDLDGDGKSDLIASSYSPKCLSVILANGAGGFGSPAGFFVVFEPNSLAVGDLNFDGKSDLAVANAGEAAVSILLNQSTSTGPFKASIASCNPNPIRIAATPTPTLTIEGTGLLGATDIAVGTRRYAAGEFIILNDNTIRVVFNPPPGEIGAVDVVVSTPAGASAPHKINIQLAAGRVAFANTTTPAAGGSVTVYLAGPTPGNSQLIAYSECLVPIPRLPYATYGIGGCGDIQFTDPTPAFDAAGLSSITADVPSAFHGAIYVQFADVNIADLLAGVFPFPMSNILALTVP